ncbi:MAG: arsenite methyltransferase [Candidatus Pacebacteria bacterium]|nr:arsenite methyltransferase [Candidatus Paceibacterota bacterium]
MRNSEEIKKIVKKKYASIAKDSNCGCGCGCGQKVAKEIGYSDQEISGTEGNLGLGCGNPVAFSKIKEGDTVLDLGCGAGFDCFLAARKVGSTGKVIGVDMTKEMIERAKLNAEKLGTKNVEFMLSEIEKMPIPDNSIDIIITNCVVNLTPDKSETFKEARRVLKTGGRIYLSDIVLLEDLSEEQRNNDDLLSGCVAGALLKDDYLNKLKAAGFKVNILKEDKEISKSQYKGIALESLMVEAVK